MQFHATGSVLTGGIIMGSNATVNGPLALLRLPGCVHLAKKDAEHGQYEEGIYSAETHTPWGFGNNEKELLDAYICTMCLHVLFKWRLIVSIDADGN